MLAGSSQGRAVTDSPDPRISRWLARSIKAAGVLWPEVRGSPGDRGELGLSGQRRVEVIARRDISAHERLLEDRIAVVPALRGVDLADLLQLEVEVDVALADPLPPLYVCLPRR